MLVNISLFPNVRYYYMVERPVHWPTKYPVGIARAIEAQDTRVHGKYAIFGPYN